MDSDSVKKEIEKFKAAGGKIKKLPTRRAQGATTDCSVCASGFSASGLARGKAQARYFAEKRAQKTRKKIRKRRKKMGGRLATENQKKVMQRMNISFDDRMKMSEAWNLIGQSMRLRKEKVKAELGRYRGSEILREEDVREGIMSGKSTIIRKNRRVGETN